MNRTFLEPIDLSECNILVTGGHGFLGSALVEKLRELSPQKLFAPRKAECDLTDEASVTQLFRESTPDVVFHLAAKVGGIESNRTQPASFFRDNVLMNTHVVHEAAKNGVRKLITFGSMCAYPLEAPIPFKEQFYLRGELEPTNLSYGMSKRALLVQLLGYRQEFNLNAIHLIPASLYGPRDNFDLNASHVVAALIRKCLIAMESGSPAIECWGSGAPVREFLFVDDCVDAVIKAAESYSESTPLNIGSGEEWRIVDLVAAVMHAVGYRGEVIWNQERPDGQLRRSLDPSSCRKELSFVARTPLSEGLKKTIEWYLKSS